MDGAIALACWRSQIVAIAGLLPPLALAAPLPGPHAEHAAQFERLEGAAASTPAAAWHAPRVLPARPPPATHRVYGYLAWWDDDLTTVPWDALTDLALFQVEVAADGTLGSTAHWDATADALALAAPYDVAIHLCVTQFDTATLRTLLGSATARARLVTALADAVDARGADGVNIDFEGMPADRRDEMVAFVQALAAEVDEVVLAIPAVDWSDAWDLAALDDHADLFLMGYAYHYAGSSRTGPNDPLFHGGDVGSISLSRSIQTYLGDGVDPARLILGLPLYGYRWPVAAGDDAVGATTTGSGSAVFWSETAADPSAPRWESVSHTPWRVGASTQTWFATVRSVTDRIDHALTMDLAGIGFWALNYDDGDDALWTVVRDRTRLDDPEDEGGPDDSDTPPADSASPTATLRVGEPLLVRPGDIAVLQAAVDGRDVDGWRWTQTAGQAVTLDDPHARAPRFLVPAVGSYAFEVEPLMAGEALGRADAWVVAISPAGRPRSGCDTGGASALGLLGLLTVLTASTRRRPRPVRHEHDRRR